MSFASIEADPTVASHANLRDYGETCARFTWDKARARLDSLPGGGLNIAYEAIDRHVVHGIGDKVAIHWIGQDGGISDFSYADLAQQTNRFANVLRELGIGKGDRVYSLLGRVPELYITALGTLKNGSVFCPMFSAFGPEPIKSRMSIGEANVLITTEALYRRKVAAWRSELPSLRYVILIQCKNEPPKGTADLGNLMDAASDDFRDRAHRTGGHGAPAFHQRHHRPAEGRGPCA